MVDPREGVLFDLLVLEQLRGHQGDVVCRGQVTFLVQTVAVFERGVVHSQRFGLVVHHAQKVILGARHMLRKGHGGVVRAHDHGRLDQIVDRHGFPLLEPNIRPAHRGRVGAGRDRIGEGNFAGINCLHHQQERHDLGNGSGGTLFMGIFFIQNLAGLCFHQNRRRGLYLFVRNRRCRSRGGNQDAGGQQHRDCLFFPIHLSYTSSIENRFPGFFRK